MSPPRPAFGPPSDDASTRDSSRRFRGRVGTAVLATLIALSLPRAAVAQVDPKVQEHFQAGNSLYEDGRYKDALVEYDAAYELSKNWKILFNRGQCLVMLKREPDAIVSFEQYLHDGGDQVPAERRVQVEGDIKKLKGRLGSIVVNGAPAGARVDIDGFFAGKTPLPGPIPAGSGYHDVTITPVGGKPATGAVKVTAGEKTSFEVQVVAEPGAAPPPSGPVEPPSAPPLAAAPLVLPPRAPGGLVAPGYQLSAQLGLGLPTPDYRHADPPALASFEVGASWRATSFWEVGLYGGGAAGRYSLDAGVRNEKVDPSLGIVNVDPNVAYSYGTLGVRARMHLVRTKKIDGWFGVDLGAWSETWKVTGVQSFDYTANSAAFGLGLGFDVPLTRRWAVGFATRFLAASASDGKRSGCSANIDCDKPYLPGEGPSSGRSTARGLFEFGLRLVWSIPSTAEPAPKPAEAPSKAPPSKAPPATANSRSGSSLLNEPPIW